MDGRNEGRIEEGLKGGGLERKGEWWLTGKGETDDAIGHHLVCVRPLFLDDPL